MSRSGIAPMKRIVLWASGLLAVALCFAPPAFAQDMQVKLEVVDPAAAAPAEGAQKDGKAAAGEAKKAGPPGFRAVVSLRRPGLTADKFVLRDIVAEPPVTATADKVVPYIQSDDPMALVILVEGTYSWMGNETYVDASDPTAPTIYNGAFSGLGPAIDTLAKAGPPGSRAALFVYTGELVPKQPMDSADKLSGAALGGQQAYGDVISRAFQVGLTGAWRTLAKESGHRKVLVVLSDGLDDSQDFAAPLRKVIDDLQAIHAEVYTIYYGGTSTGPTGQQNMRKLGYSGHYVATSRDSFQSFAANIVEVIGARYYAYFPGKGFVFDGASHDYVVVVDGTESEPQTLTVPVYKPPVNDGGSLWWLWLLIALVVVVVLVVVIVVVLKNRAQALPPPPVEAPAPGPQKTVMLGVGGNEDAMPIVGWIVPVTGPQQYQTFKLLTGETKVGTGGASHIHIDDQFMSTEHATIVGSPAGFSLNDLGSTNGTFVNQNRIKSHDLVDNDVFTLGRTDFKFKSIN